MIHWTRDRPLLVDPMAGAACAVPRFEGVADPTAPPRILAYDREWQTPAITEQHAFELIGRNPVLLGGLTYVAFPWATLIDRIRRKAAGRDVLHAALQRLTQRKDSGATFVTVCQHIDAQRHLRLFAEARIDHLFWSHAVRRSPCRLSGATMELHPFPLFPVQTAGQATYPDRDERRHLYVFVGARASQWYPKPTRNWIIEHLQGDPRGVVIGRDVWHYNRVVYEGQILGGAASDASLIDDAASAVFRETLEQSVFSLCPSGTGPNSIRLWESVAAGAIPVILADGYAPPGDWTLWQEAAVFCPEQEDEVRALPDRLAAMAADLQLLERKRGALRQIRLLYGLEGFVYDIHKLALSSAPVAKIPDPPAPEGAGIIRVRRALGQALTRGAEFLRPLSRPAIGGRRPRVALWGKHANRVPLAYRAYRPYVERDLDIVERPENADILVFGFSVDIRDNAESIAALRARNRALKLVVLSEEPLWDTLWSEDFRNRDARRKVKEETFAFTFLNHATTNIFAFRRIPYFVTTTDDFTARYASLFNRNLDVAPDDLLAHWRRAEVRAAFYAAKRIGRRYQADFAEQDTYGLSHFRSLLAEQVRGTGVRRVGDGWSDGPPRQSVPDWHLEKLAELDRRTFVASGLENTHHRSYVTEKIFDAFAALAVPIYHASAHHRVHDIVAAGSFLNVFGQSAEAAAGMLEGFAPDRAFAERYLETQHRLAALFSEGAHLVAERRRVASEIVRELTSVIAGGRRPGLRIVDGARRGTSPAAPLTPSSRRR